MRLRKWVPGLAGCMLVSAAAQAQTPSSSKVTAEALFEDARQLMTEGKYDDACPKFAASERLDPSTATLLNLASCYERQGRTATAWATYREAASAANAAGRNDYLTTAERHASGLEPSLARLTITVEQPVEGLHLERDGIAVERAEWGIAIPVDPGTHSLAASAPGHKSWASTVAVTRNGAQVALVVPALEALPVASPEVPPPPPPASAVVSPAAPIGVDSNTGSSTQRAMGWVVGSVGVAGLVVGTAFAISAKNKYNDSLSECEPLEPNLCTSQGVSERSNARSQGDAATLAFGLGAAAIIAGGVLWFTAPHSGSVKRGAALVVIPTLGGALVKGTW
jgi:hypothetical protein